MKWSELRQLSDAALATELEKISEEMRNLRFQKSTGSLENPLLVRKTRRTAARIRTILRERQSVAAPSAPSEGKVR